MSKTLRSRIAAVAVAALGAGLLQAASASAADIASAKVTAINVTTANKVIRVGDAFDAGVVSVNTGTAGSATETLTLKAVFTERPVASTLVAPAFTAISVSGSGAIQDDAGNVGSITATAGSGTTAAQVVVTPSASKFIAGSQTGAKVATAFTFTPDVAGKYITKIWHDANANGFIDTGEAVKTVTVNAGGIPAGLSIAQFGATAASVNTSLNASTTLQDGSLMRLQLKDAAGNPTKLGGGEGLRVDGTNTVTLNGSADSLTLTDTSTVDVNGYILVNIKKSSAGSSTVTISPVGTISAAFAAQSKTVTFTAPTTASSASGTFEIYETTGTSATSITGVGGTGTSVTAAPAKTTIKYKYTHSTLAGTSRYIMVNVQDDTGAITGVVGAEYTIPVALNDTTGVGTFSITVTRWSTLLSDGYKVVSIGSDNTTNSLQANLSVALSTVNGTNSTWAYTSISAVPTGSVSATLTVKDQYGLAMSGQPVTFAIAGRNAAITAGLYAVTDSLGKATLTYTDAGTSGATDTVSATAGSGSTAVSTSVTVSFAVGNSVSTVKLTGGNTSAGVTSTVLTYNTIDAEDGAEGGAQAISATVKNADGIALAGVPVTWTVAGTGAAILSTKVTGYTNALGVTSTSVYAWLAGTYTITATAGGISGTATISFRQQTPAAARVLSATVTGQTVTAKVVDRFGNPVVGARVYATRTGAGYFGNGATSSYADTSSAGTVDFIVAGGDASVTVSVVNPSDPAGTTFGQTCAAAGYLDCGAAAVTFTASTVGSATVAETGVGASFAPAGVASATVSVKAAVDTTLSDTKAAVASLATSVSSIQTAMSNLVASVTATLTLMQSQIAKIMKKLGIK